MHRTLIERTLYVSTCPKCGDRKEREDNPPRERRCSCGTWVPYTAETAVSPEYKALRK